MQVDLPEASSRKQHLAGKLNMVPHGVSTVQAVSSLVLIVPLSLVLSFC